MTRKHTSHRKPRKPFPWLATSSILLILLILTGIFLFFNNFVSQETNKKNVITTRKISKKKSKITKRVSWIKQKEPVKIPILMYHAVHVMDPSEAASANLIVAPDTFESHIKRLKKEGYYFLSPEEAYRTLNENALPAKKVIWITFDDGNADFYTKAYPILKKYKVKATNNIITGFVQEGRESNLNVQQMLEMKQNGMSFQGHTVTHPNLSLLTPELQTQEMTLSKQYLDQQLSQQTISIAYPYGRYNPTTLDIASQYYKLGLTTNEGVATKDNGLLSLNRVRILPTTSDDDLIKTINQ
ncbi:polysaccharide deacetylase family protein [Streptococcus agalactiae]|uniref:polysaccharide deacetylase family protein n=1 Tax=Streptococcus agalactiae TaxID=1311 RepID=UPI000332DF04|nr:polysaccharide deacetylase family protein [Streptococcus agalactiae]OTG47957.1 deacetylase [Streptococcus agalactiae]CCW40100.1 Polysaccharide deacetylase [Streptococcus agalactiae ILRI005]